MNKPHQEPEVKYSKVERRRYKRVNKNFILTYFDKNHPEDRHEITQLKNISLGGLCFVTLHHFEPGTPLGIELKHPICLTRRIWRERSSSPTKR